MRADADEVTQPAGLRGAVQGSTVLVTAASASTYLYARGAARKPLERA